MSYPEKPTLTQTSKGIRDIASKHYESSIKNQYSSTLKSPLLPMEVTKKYINNNNLLSHGDNKMSKQFKVYKDTVKHEFVIDIEEGVGVNIKLDGKPTIYENGVIKFLSSQKINKQSVGGISIPADIQKEIEEARNRLKLKNQQEKIDRELDRPAPKIDETKFFIYKVGIDTGNIYPQSHEKAIELILKKGIEPQKVFGGERDKTRRYPGMHDDHIPMSYVRREGDRYVADSYAQVWTEDVYALPIEIVEAELKVIQDQKQKNKSDKDANIQAIFTKAKETGERQVLNKWSEKCNDPDESCDVDNIIEYAMPDGTVKTERHHTY